MLDNGANLIHQSQDSLSNDGDGITGRPQATKTRQEQQQQK